MLDDIKDWCRGKSPWWRIGLLVVLGFIGMRSSFDPSQGNIFSPITLGVHELGHVLFGFLGEFLGVAGGTITQFAAPIVCTVMFFRQPDYFAPTFGGVWLATSLHNSSVYIADAVRLELPLASIGGGDVYHDWEYMLSTLNCLSSAPAISTMVKTLGDLCLLASLAYGVWIIYLIFASGE
jgi:hypothetical protein